MTNAFFRNAQCQFLQTDGCSKLFNNTWARVLHFSITKILTLCKCLYDRQWELSRSNNEQFMFFFANFNSYVSPCEHTSKSLEFWHCANVCVTDNENWVGVHWDKWAMFVLIHCKSATKLNRGCFLKWLALRSCCTMYRSFRYRSFRALQRYAL